MTHFRSLMIVCALALTIAPFTTHADSNKDESGKGDKYEKGDKYDKAGKHEGKDRYDSNDRDDSKDRYDSQDRDDSKNRYQSNDRDDVAGRDWNSYDDWVRDRSRRDRSSPYFRDRYSRMDIPYGHYPPPGKCRVWYPDRPPGQQPPPGDCRSQRDVPRGAWLIRRPHNADENVYINARGNPARDDFDVVGIYDATTGRLLREIEGR